jgi:hypothetical protein
MVLKSLDRSLGGVYAMVVWFHQLYFDVVGFQVRLHCLACYVVDNIELWFEASFGEILDVVAVCFYDGGVFDICYRCCEDGIGGPIVQDKDGRHSID